MPTATTRSRTWRPATYTITETDPAGYISTGDVDGANDNTIVATVPAGVTVTGRDFGDVKLGSIGGIVWNDLNSNGILDGGEPGIPGVPVCAVPVGAACRSATVTDASGNYTIPNVPPGAYTVTETDPAGMVSTTPNTVPVTVPSGGTATAELRGRGAEPGARQHQRHGVCECQRRRRLRSQRGAAGRRDR